MNLRAYLADHLISLIIALVCCLGIGGMLLVLGAGMQAAIIAACFIAVCAAGAITINYARRKHFYNELKDLVENLSQTYLVSSLMDEPDFLEGRITYHALEKISKVSADEIADSHAQTNAYRDYIEMWIHEIKTPIAAAGLMTDNLHGGQSVKLKGELDRIETCVEQALYYARSTSLAKDYAIREVVLADVVFEVCRKNARYLIEQGTTPQIEIDAECKVFSDSKWLTYIVGQLVINSAKYGATQINFSSHEEGTGTTDECTVLTVSDNGCGIPAADVPRVFDRGFTGVNGRVQGSSTGMGLYLAATMCQKMGLGLSIASEEGTGTRVMVAFPHDRRRLEALT